MLGFTVGVATEKKKQCVFFCVCSICFLQSHLPKQQINGRQNQNSVVCNLSSGNFLIVSPDKCVAAEPLSWGHEASMLLISLCTPVLFNHTCTCLGYNVAVLGPWKASVFLLFSRHLIGQCKGRTFMVTLNTPTQTLDTRHWLAHFVHIWW